MSRPRVCRPKGVARARWERQNIPIRSLHPDQGISALALERIYTGRDNIRCMALTADSTIAELLREKPESVQVLFRFGMGCLGCAIANNETIREAAQVHGIPLEEMLSALGVAEA